MRARGKVEMEDLLIFISISLWEGAIPSHGCEMRVMGGGGLEVSHHREMHDRAMHLAVVSLVVVVMCVLCDSCSVYRDYSE